MQTAAASLCILSSAALRSMFSRRICSLTSVKDVRRNLSTSLRSFRIDWERSCVVCVYREIRESIERKYRDDRLDIQIERDIER